MYQQKFTIAKIKGISLVVTIQKIKGSLQPYRLYEPREPANSYRIDHSVVVTRELALQKIYKEFAFVVPIISVLECATSEPDYMLQCVQHEGYCPLNNTEKRGFFILEVPDGSLYYNDGQHLEITGCQQDELKPSTAWLYKIAKKLGK